MYDYTTVSIRTTTDGELLVTIALWRQDPTRRQPRLLQAPWRHQWRLRDTVEHAVVHEAVKAALRSLADPL